LRICITLDTFVKIFHMNPLVSTWQISHRINIYLLDAIDEAALGDQPVSKGRTVGEQFAHLHNVRLMWLQAAAPELMEGLAKLDKETISKNSISSALEKSAVAISTLIEQGIEAGRIKGFKPSPEAFAGYLMAHEAHHRGQLLIALKENKHLPEKKVLFGMWEWGVR
jgi:uncharacterized damage-inducible protein DinB